WQDRKTKSKSALSWLFSAEASADAFLEKKGEFNTSGRVRAAFGESEVIAVEDLPESSERVFAPTSALRTSLAPRIFDKEIDRSWRISSFSSLISGRTEEPETPDYDRLEPGVVIAEEPVRPTQGIHTLPGGMRAGACLDLILAELEFAVLSDLRLV